MAALQHALTAIDRASYVTRTIAARLGAAHPAVPQLAHELYALEVQASQVFAELTRRPVPAPNGNEVGTWAGQARMHLSPVGATLVPDGFVEAADALARKAEAFATSGAQAQPAGFGRPAPAAQGAPMGHYAEGMPPVAAPGQSMWGKRILGALMALAGAGGSAVAAYNLYKKGTPMIPEGADTPDGARAQGQGILDNEMPGAHLTLQPAPDGAWIASVRRGGRVVARAETAAPGEAVGTVVRHAMGAEVLEGEVVAEVVEPEKRKSGRADPVPQPPAPPKPKRAAKKRAAGGGDEAAAVEAAAEE